MRNDFSTLNDGNFQDVRDPQPEASSQCTEESMHPLFMSKLPSDAFTKNSSLQALVSLIEDGESKEDEGVMMRNYGPIRAKPKKIDYKERVAQRRLNYMASTTRNLRRNVAGPYVIPSSSSAYKVGAPIFGFSDKQNRGYDAGIIRTRVPASEAGGIANSTVSRLEYGQNVGEVCDVASSSVNTGNFSKAPNSETISSSDAMPTERLPSSDSQSYSRSLAELQMSLSMWKMK